MIHVIHPDGRVDKINERKPSLARLQELVGGYIELLPRGQHRLDKHVLVDEDGISKDLPANKPATALTGWPSWLRGPVVVVELDDLD